MDQGCLMVGKSQWIAIQGDEILTPTLVVACLAGNVLQQTKQRFAILGFEVTCSHRDARVIAYLTRA
jgi:hypothetical protein